MNHTVHRSVDMDSVAPVSVAGSSRDPPKPGDALLDPALNHQPLEVYLYFARIERQRETLDARPEPDAPWIAMGKRLTGRENEINPVVGARAIARGDPSPREGWSAANGSSTELKPLGISQPAIGMSASVSAAEKSRETVILTEREQQSAYHLLRVAGWQVVFYLITTDMLGWITAPKTFSMLGFGPGALVYTGFFLLAFASGQMLWRLYMRLDSEQYPIRSYADIGERTYGPAARIVFNVLQTMQLMFNVGMFIVMQGQALAQIIDFKFCYLALNVFFALIGMLLTQIRTLRNIGWFTSANLFINLFIMLMTAFGVALYDPVPAQSGHRDLKDPIVLSGWVPQGMDWHNQVAGVQLAVFAYGGAMIFMEFLAEMRRPADFWKAALAAQGFCWITYLFFGMFAYGMQGQYSSILPTVNMANRVFQGVINILGIACVCAISILYAHVGCKILYRVVLRGYFRAPSLASRKSVFYWGCTVVIYWTIAWAIGSAIPNITDLNIVVGAACALQFTYTFPPMLLLGHWMQCDAAKDDLPWYPGMQPRSNRVDCWREWSRWKRALAPWWYAKLFLLVLVLGALSLAGLGIYSGVLTATTSYRQGVTTAYSCRAPGQPA